MKNKMSFATRHRMLHVLTLSMNSSAYRYLNIVCGLTPEEIASAVESNGTQAWTQANKFVEDMLLEQIKNQIRGNE